MGPMEVKSTLLTPLHGTGLWRDARFQPSGRWRPSGKRIERRDVPGERASKTTRSPCLRMTAECASGGTPALRHSGQAKLPLSAEYARI